MIVWPRPWHPMHHKCKIKHLVTQPGLSRARNLGLKAVSAEVVAFPDDDCWYPATLLEQVRNLLSNTKGCDGVIGHSVDDTGKVILPWNDQAGQLSLSMSWRRALTYTYFIRKNVVDITGSELIHIEKLSKAWGGCWFIKLFPPHSPSKLTAGVGGSGAGGKRRESRKGRIAELQQRCLFAIRSAQ
jgi:glycosyltransferase involved in cell wall biosynthesis